MRSSEEILRQNFLEFCRNPGPLIIIPREPSETPRKNRFPRPFPFKPSDAPHRPPQSPKTMSTKDDRRDRSAKDQMASRMPPLDNIDDDEAPTYSPTTSRRRPRRPGSGTGAQLRFADSQQRRSQASVARLLLSAVDLCSKNTAKCALLTCVSGAAWASLIVWILGPAVPAPGAMPPVGDHHQVPGLGHGSGYPIGDHNSEGFWLPGWTPLGHHSRFLGREAFPEQFEHWGEEGEVVINGVDVAPLAAGDEVLPRTDLVLAILSGDDEVCALHDPGSHCVFVQSRGGRFVDC